MQVDLEVVLKRRNIEHNKRPIRDCLQRFLMV